VRGEQNPYARHVGSGLNEIEEGSLESVPGRELFDGAMQGMVDVLLRHGDEHSQYFPEREAEPLRSEIRQQFGGIGVQIRLAGDPPRLTIPSPPEPGTPAAMANLLPGDQILAIDGHPTEDMEMIEVLSRMRGDPGTTVQLLIQSELNKVRRTVDLIREIIHINSVLGDIRRGDGTWQFRLADPRIAHVRIALFGDRTVEELADLMNQLVGDGVLAVVLDLRDNAGGVLDAAVGVCDMFLPGGRVIVETRGKGGALRKRYETTGNGLYPELPLAIVVNQESASAAEIVAACLQDHRRAAVVGERTYGKGTVQQVIPLAGTSLLKLTWASFWRPNGISIHRKADAPDNASWGVVPDAGLELPLSAKEYADYRAYRSQRDLSNIDNPVLGDPQDGNLAATEFVDEQLKLAVGHLRAKLEAKP
jgi:carboxyl-terminal processing protease